MRIFISALLLLLIVLLTHFIQRDVSIRIAIYIVTIPQLIFALNTIFVAVFTANNRFGFDALMQITSRGLEFLSILLVVYFKLGFIALFVGIGASYLINGFLGLTIYLKIMVYRYFNMILNIVNTSYMNPYQLQLQHSFP